MGFKLVRLDEVVKSIPDVGGSDCWKSSPLNFDMWIDFSANFDHFKGNSLALSITVKPKDKLSVTPGKFLDIFGNFVHIGTKFLDHGDLTEQNLLIIKIFPAFALGRKLVIKQMTSNAGKFHGCWVIFELIDGVVFAEGNAGSLVRMGQNIGHFFGDTVFLSYMQNWHLRQTIINEFRQHLSIIP